MTLEAKAEQKDTTAAEASEVTTAAEMETGETAARALVQILVVMVKTEAVIKGTQVTEMETTAVSRKRATAKVTETEATASEVMEAIMVVARRRWGMAGA